MYSVVLMMALSGSAEATEFGCRGCHGCHGCHGGHHHRCHGCYGGCYGYSSCYGYSGCSGYSGYGCGGYASYGYGGYCGCCGAVAPVAPVAPTTPPAEGPEKKEEGKEKKSQEARRIAPATIVVTLPADARLTVDGRATTSTTARRVLITPALQVGSSYTYTLRAEINGQPVSEQIVTVRGGQTSEVSFSFASSVASR